MPSIFLRKLTQRTLGDAIIKLMGSKAVYISVVSIYKMNELMPRVQ